MLQKIQAIRGMNDILPTHSYQWDYLETLFRQWLGDYGYQMIRTPLLEATPLFVRSIGEVTDIVEKEMYTFVDTLNGDSLTLRPEGTAGVLRAVLEHHLLYNTTQRLAYIGAMFRHERPQKGRYRQFHQMGAEALGFAGPDIDAEMIVMLADLWRRLQLETGLTLQINTLGDKEERVRYRQALIHYLEQYSDQLDDDGKRRLYTNPLRILDSKNPALQDICQQAPKGIDFLGAKARAHYEEWKAMIAKMGIQYVENPRLVRGLDYYNRSVFEWVSTDLGAQGTVCAGGRYDGLIEQLAGQAAPGIGFAIGIERILLLMQQKQSLPAVTHVDVYLVQQGSGAAFYALSLAQTLRAAGYTVLQHCGEDSFKAQMKKADASGARYAVIVGENEIASGSVTIKPLRIDLPQKTVASTAVIPTLAAFKASSI